MTKIKINKNGKVNIKWNVKPIDYNKDTEKSIIAKFSDKYGIPKDSITVEPVMMIGTKDGNPVSVTENMIGDIQNPHFQQDVLFKRYLEENDITDCDFKKIIEIDNSINSLINYDEYRSRKNYSLKWIKWSNFMSYGPDNYFDFTTLNGLTLLTSEPANQGGKTTFCLDLLRFLFYGKVTSRDSDWTLSKVFNIYRPEETEVSVEGCIELNGENYVIKRVVTRPPLKKRTAKSRVAHKVSYYKIVNGEYVDLEDNENLNEDTSTETNIAIKEAIGNEKDFDLMICVNDSNLKGLISLKDTDRGRLLSRWIGLLPLEEKEQLARQKYNASIARGLVSSLYNKDELSNLNKKLRGDNDEYRALISELEKKVSEKEKEVDAKTKERDRILSSMEKIDKNLIMIDVKTLENELAMVSEEGKRKQSQIELEKENLKKYNGISFDETEYEAVDKKFLNLSGRLAELRQEILTKRSKINTLKKGEYCPTCGARLKGVDNSKLIESEQESIDRITIEGKKCASDVEKAKQDREKLSTKRKEYNEKLRIELLIEKLGVDIECLRAKYREKKQMIATISDNKAAIEKNNELQQKANILSELIGQVNKEIRNMSEQISANKTQIVSNNSEIEKNEKFIESILSEEVLVRNWKIYLTMIGKNGVSKMVLRSILPFINGELKNILNGVCDFTVEIAIDEFNDVSFLMTHNGVTNSLSSGSGFEQTVASLALRSILAKISSFSKPSFVVFDEILGGVADENYDSVRKLYEKISKDYDFILQISHLKNLYEWHKNFIKITKNGDISTIEKVA